MATIERAAVIGAGTMGSGIAAHLANAGIDVLLLDLDEKQAAGGIERQLKLGGFMDPSFAVRVRPGSSGNLQALSTVDWIIEAVAERLDIKLDLYRRIEAVRKPGAIVSSNTSTIPLSALLAGRTDEFARHFLVAHFFNPPRRMRLLELIAGPKTLPAVVEAVRAFSDLRLGKGVVFAKDTPGFIGNRIGIYWMAAAEHEAIEAGLDIEDVDALVGKPFGIPATGIFGLLDLVGLDLMPAILESLRGALPASDALAEYAQTPPVVADLIRRGHTGRKAGAGYFRVSADRKTRETLDLRTGQYRPQKKVDEALVAEATRDLRALMSRADPLGQLVGTVMEKTLAYAAALVPEIADSPASVDEAMRLGYGWQAGPFEIIDRLGPGWLAERLVARGLVAPSFLLEAAAANGFYSTAQQQRMYRVPGQQPRPLKQSPGTLSLADLKLRSKPVAESASTSLWDLADGVGLIEIHSKANALSTAVLLSLAHQFDRAAHEFRAIVVGGGAANFSAGADLREVLAAAEAGSDKVAELLLQGQALFQSIKYSPIPVVAGAAGWALGGGCELALHCNRVQAHAELAIGLVEVNVGLVPGWGGCKELLLRLCEPGNGRPQGPVAGATAAFELIGGARISGSAFEARTRGFLRPVDGITMNSARLLADAKMEALRLSANFTPIAPRTLALAGPSGAAALRTTLAGASAAGRLSAHDQEVGSTLIEVLTGGASADPARPVSEEAVSALEREAFVHLLGMPKSLDRIRHMLATGKPLRN